jgi:hypothetical protein
MKTRNIIFRICSLPLSHMKLNLITITIGLFGLAQLGNAVVL